MKLRTLDPNNLPPDVTVTPNNLSEDDWQTNNLQVNFVLMIAREGEEVIRPAEDADNQFIGGARNNILVGNCTKNVFDGARNNVITYRPQIIRIKNRKLSRWERIKTAWNVYRNINQFIER